MFVALHARACKSGQSLSLNKGPWKAARPPPSPSSCSLSKFNLSICEHAEHVDVGPDPCADPQMRCLNQWLLEMLQTWGGGGLATVAKGAGSHVAREPVHKPHSGP